MTSKPEAMCGLRWSSTADNKADRQVASRLHGHWFGLSQRHRLIDTRKPPRTPLLIRRA